MNPLVSIIIPSFNRGYLIAETLDSILRQSHSEWECLVIDDHSTDDTQAIVQQFIEKDPRFSFARRPEDRPKGANACRNFGFESSKGQYINWVDSDDILKPNHLALHLECHLKESVDAAVTNAAVFAGTMQNIIRDWSITTPNENLIREMIATKVLWQTNCVTWNRSCVPEKPFSEDLASSQEWTFHLSQIINGISYKIIPQTTCLVREHTDRIGKLISIKKSYSTFASRKKILLLLEQKQMLDKNCELALLKYIFMALRQSLQFRYYAVTRTILKFLLGFAVNSKNKTEIARVVFIALPIYFATKKGEKLFRLKLS